MMLCALSVWGNPQDMMVILNSTETAVERIAAIFNGLPLGLDERQAAGDDERGQKKIENIIYQIGESKGKARATIGGLQQGKRWRTIALSTGERSIQDENTQGGISTRVFSIEGGAFKGKEGKDVYSFLSKQNYGWAGPEFIKRMSTVSNKDLLEQYKQFLEYSDTKETDDTSSHTQLIAAVAFADSLATDWIFNKENEELNEIDPKKFRVTEKARTESFKLIDEIIEIQKTEPENDNYINATQAVLDWIKANADRAFISDIGSNERYGYLSADGKIAYIFPSKLYEAMRKAGNYYFSQFRSEWGKAGIIKMARTRSGTNEYTYPSSIANGQRCVWFYIDEAKAYIDNKAGESINGTAQDTEEDFMSVDESMELPFD